MERKAPKFAGRKCDPVRRSDQDVRMMVWGFFFVFCSCSSANRKMAEESLKKAENLGRLPPTKVFKRGKRGVENSKKYSGTGKSTTTASSSTDNNPPPHFTSSQASPPQPNLITLSHHV